MIARADKPADGGVARGEQKAGARRLGQQRLDVGLAPHVIHHDQRRFVGDGGAVLVLAGQGGVVAAEVVASALATSRISSMKSRFLSLPAVIQTMPSGKARCTTSSSAERLGQHRLADAAHAGQRGEGDGLAVVFGKERVAQGAQGFGPLQVVGDARRGGEVGDAGLVVSSGRVAVASPRMSARSSARRCGVVGVVGEVAILPGIEVHGRSAFWRPARNDAVALVEGAKLFGTADLEA